MRLPVPKNSLLTLALVGAVLTGALTVGLANPDAVAHYRNDAARWLATDDALDGSVAAAAATSQTVADVTAPPITQSASTPAATPASTPAATPAATPATTPAATPTPVPNFTPEIQQRSAPASHGDDDGYEHEEREEHDD